MTAELARIGVPVATGRVIIGVPRTYERELRALIRAFRLNLQLIFNKGSAMILPEGVDKAAGLVSGLKRLGVAPGEVVGIGDAENDLAFLDMCGLQVAVANAIDSVKAGVDVVTRQPNGAGVAEFIRTCLLPTKRFG